MTERVFNRIPSWDDLDRLLKDQGEVCIPVVR